ncbi:MAG TPA: DivIVA domain-containing protein [Solirubrobacteraceae bacterium]|nr:DivIVA domain-containing protein [Solirubrobacteraceae bacterium]
MTESPRWERESQEDLRPPEIEPQSKTEPQPTTELSNPLDESEERRWSDGEEDGEWPAREPRLAAARESLSATRDSLSAKASKVGKWLHSLDRRPEFDGGDDGDPVAGLTGGGAETREPVQPEPQPAMTRSEPEDHEAPPPLDDDRQFGVRFPTAPLGYNRQAVDDHIAALEEEIAELRNVIEPPPTINEEIERLGEQTASILVVAHDKAHETARRAQEQAARSVREAARNAERITSEAERRLRELDEETDAVWRERERLLADVREVSLTLGTLVDAAAERFPAAPEPAGASLAT